MKTLSSFLTGALLSLTAMSQDVAWNPYGIAGWNGQGAGITYSVTGTTGLVPGSQFTIVAYSRGIHADTVYSTTAVPGMTFFDSIPMLAIRLIPIDLDSAHRVTLYCTRYVQGGGGLQEMYTSDIWVDFLPMSYSIVSSCHGSVLSTSDGGDALWVAGGNFIGTGSVVPLWQADTVQAIPLVIYTGAIRYDEWEPAVGYYDPIWVHVLTTPTCINGSNGTATVIATGTAPYEYVWLGFSDTTQMITGLPAGFYNVVVTDAESPECVQARDFEIVTDTCVITSVADIPPLEPPSVYPNPASETLNIAAAGYATFEVRDVVGRMVASEAFMGGKTSMDVSALSSGTYVVIMQTDDGRVTTTQFSVAR